MDSQSAPCSTGALRLASSSQRGLAEFGRLLDRLPAGAYMCDNDGLITYFNNYAVRVWGREPKLNDPEDRFCGSFKLYAADGSPIKHNQCWMALALQDRKEFNGHEIIVERPDGFRATVLAHANPVYAESGGLLGAVNVLIDITERKRAESAKDEFLAMLAHELRNPLAPIRNAVHVLQLKSPPVPEITRMLEVINRQMTHMTRLVDDLLDVSRISRDKIVLRKARLSLTEVVNTALETSRPVLTASGQAFAVAMPPMPVSRTRISSSLPSADAESSTSPPGGVYLMALVRRLPNT
jgi:signal transduction histidine kinase